MNLFYSITRGAALTVAATAVLLFPPDGQTTEGWLVDFEKAKAQAAKEGKSILMEFTGSDWCPPCKALAKNVLTKDVFKKEIPKGFVLLKLDNPSDKSKQTPEEIEQYKTLSKKYAIQGVPTIFLADAKGRPYWQTVGYMGEPADKYVANLKDQLKILAKMDAAFEKAENASGSEKAQHIDNGLSLVLSDQLVLTCNNDVSEIIKLDAKNKAGLKGKYEILKNNHNFKVELTKIIQSDETDPKAVLAAIDNLINEKDPTNEAKQEAIFYKGSIYFRDDKPKAKISFLEAQKLAPESETAKRITGILDRFFKE